MEGQGIRRSDRVSLELPIQVSGTDTTGNRFVVETRTVVLSRHGAKILLDRELAAGQELNIRCLSTGKEAGVRVVGQIGGELKDGYYTFNYGVEFLNPADNPWEIDFPPLAESEKAVVRILLECTSCHTRQVTYLGELEAEVFAANQCISRPCKRCAVISLWREAVAPEASQEIPLAVDPQAVAQRPQAPPPRTLNERKEVRVKLQMKACIRTAEFGDLVVVTENVSRGGFSFKSPERFGTGSIVEVCVPYSPGAGNIFSPARIEHLEALPQEGLHAYGVAYIPAHRGWPGK